ncbi:MAG TPA: hypothetical protein VFP30_03360 [Candidatus Limnocylindria bacterium]|nr:hypothetical protein [Candidatus Limnocylindria bacterium]
MSAGFAADGFASAEEAPSVEGLDGAEEADDPELLSDLESVL